jgi:hypothetical protein
MPTRQVVRVEFDMDGPSEESRARLLAALGATVRPIVHVAGDPREGLFDRVEEALGNTTGRTPVIIIDSISAFCSPTQEKGSHVRPAAENRHTYAKKERPWWQGLLRR